MKGLHIIKPDPSRENFSIFDFRPLSQHPNLRFLPKYYIQMIQFFMKVNGYGKKRLMFFMFLLKKRKGSNGIKLGSHPHNVFTKWYNNNILSLFTNFA